MWRTEKEYVFWLDNFGVNWIFAYKQLQDPLGQK